MDDTKLRDEIQRVILGLEAGWNRASGEEFARDFEEDAEFVNIYGSYARGRAAIGDAHEVILHSVYSGSKLALTVMGVRELADGVAVAHVSGVMENGGREIRALPILVLRRGAEGWRISAFHNVLVEEGHRA
jgi:uncharacterized protein (TIGR02246 family)